MLTHNTRTVRISGTGPGAYRVPGRPLFVVCEFPFLFPRSKFTDGTVTAVGPHQQPFTATVVYGLGGDA